MFNYFETEHIRKRGDPYPIWTSLIQKSGNHHKGLKNCLNQNSRKVVLPHLSIYTCQILSIYIYRTQTAKESNHSNSSVSCGFSYIQFMLEHVGNCWQVLDGCCKTLGKVKQICQLRIRKSMFIMHPSPKIEVIWMVLPNWTAGFCYFRGWH